MQLEVHFFEPNAISALYSEYVHVKTRTTWRNSIFTVSINAVDVKNLLLEASPRRSINYYYCILLNLRHKLIVLV
jgi:hypothetical protein